MSPGLCSFWLGTADAVPRALGTTGTPLGLSPADAERAKRLPRLLARQVGISGGVASPV